MQKYDAVFTHECFINGKETTLVRLYRISNKMWKKNRKRSAWFIRNIIRIIYNCQIHPSAEIGKPAHFGHGLNIVIGQNATIGNKINITHNCTIAAGTIIGNNFFMGPGAVIVESIKIGNNVRIGANAVITQDVPDNTLATGIPAKYKEIKN